MLQKLLSTKIRSINFLLLIILTFSLLIRLYNLHIPRTYVFDEVYYAFTAQEYLKGNTDAWGWWGNPPEGKAYAWVNPPLPQEIMSVSMYLFGSENTFSWRLPGAILGTLSIYLTYLIAKKLFNSHLPAVFSALILSFDGLILVQSRTAMLDIYLLTFILASLYFYLDKKIFLSVLFLGFALSSKWTAVYLIVFFILLFLHQRTLEFFSQHHKFTKSSLTDFCKMFILNSSYLYIPVFLLIISLTYLSTYIPFFLSGHSFQRFQELLQQAWWYHMNLNATHDYASPWWSWPLNLYPVWYYVDYPKGAIANIFASGNPLVFLGGIVSLIFLLIEYFKKPAQNLFFIILGFLIFWLPWSLSPRIMFLYYFLPTVPFISIAFGYQLTKLYEDKNTKLSFYILISAIIFFFALLYPLLTAIPLSRELLDIFFRTNLSKNPFGT